MTDPAEPVAAT